mgnify:CR=1 FL=1
MRLPLLIQISLYLGHLAFHGCHFDVFGVGELAAEGITDFAIVSNLFRFVLLILLHQLVFLLKLLLSLFDFKLFLLNPFLGLCYLSFDLLAAHLWGQVVIHKFIHLDFNVFDGGILFMLYLRMLKDTSVHLVELLQEFLFVESLLFVVHLIV